MTKQRTIRVDHMNAARGNRDDEFYTPMSMIEKELAHYDKRLFKGKKILCNCDDPGDTANDERVSAFFKYFYDRFDEFELEQLVGIRYAGSALFSKERGACSRVVYRDKNGNRRTTLKRLSGDGGGFDEREGRERLKECHIVITNPPFSKWREYMKILLESKKEFLVIGLNHAVSYKDIFPYILKGKMWLGINLIIGGFIRPDGTTGGPACYWYTNLKHDRRGNVEVPLTAAYSAADYPVYDDVPAIEVGRVKNIPIDYDGDMGVPIGFLEKHNPNQFEIVRCCSSPKLKGKNKFVRIIIRRAGAKPGWKETTDLTTRTTFGDAGGFIYVATKEGEKGYKIGLTGTSVADRVFGRDAFSTTRPKVVLALEVVNRFLAEKQIHDALKMVRVKDDAGRYTEWFDVSKSGLESVLSHAAARPIKLWEEAVDHTQVG